MKKQEIERMYTQKVAELLNQGWQVHTSTMPGHQGEVAHIDLTDGSEIRRVLLVREMAWGHEEDDFYGDKVTILVGRSTDQIVPSWDSIIWNEHLDTLSQIELAEIQAPCHRHPDGWYTDFAEAARISQIRNARRKLRERVQSRELGDAFKSVGLRWLRKQPRMKTTRLEDITKMTVTLDLDTHGRTHRIYRIEAKGRSFTLRT